MDTIFVMIGLFVIGTGAFLYVQNTGRKAKMTQ